MRRSEQDSCHFTKAERAAKARSVRDLTAKDPRIRRALELLQQTHKLQLGDISTALNLSGSRLRHLFRQELGMSPKHYLRLARLEQAKELLEHSFLRVKEITALVGVNDVSHFVRDYKALYGQTPSQTRALPGSAPRRIPRIAVTANK